MFIKILTKEYRGEKYYYASLVENKRINGKVVQTVKANLGAVTEDQIPYLKAAYARPDRHYHRTKGQLAADFSNTHKRSF